jgi:hypothetical protein
MRVILSAARNRVGYVGTEISTGHCVKRSLVPLGMTRECYVLTPSPLTLFLSRLRFFFDRHIPFQVRIPFQAGHEVRDEAVGFLSSEVLRVADLSAERGE